MEKEKILINKAIIHILDSENTMPILSDNLLELSDEVKEFIVSHIAKISISDDCKECFFREKPDIIDDIIGCDGDDFIDSTKSISLKIYDIMRKNVEIPSADTLFVTFKYEGTFHLAILKLNYKESFVHFVDMDNNLTQNKIIRHKTILPSETQKVDEAAIINLNDLTIKLIERPFEINGKRSLYLSSLVFECSAKISPKGKLKIINRTADELNKKYFEDDIEKKVEFKQAMHREITETGKVDINTVADEVFENEEIKQEFKEKINKYGFLNEKLEFKNKNTTKKFETQTITTDTGIEINIPIDMYQNRELLEFINNPDGTISIIIKNVTSLL